MSVEELTLCNNCGEVFVDLHGTNVNLSFDTSNFKEYVRDLKGMHEPDDEEDIFIGCPNCQTDGNLQDVFIETLECPHCKLDFYRPYKGVATVLPHILTAVNKDTEQEYKLEQLKDLESEVPCCPKCGTNLKETLLLNGDWA